MTLAGVLSPEPLTTPLPYAPDGGAFVSAWLRHDMVAWFDSAAPGPQSRFSYLCIDPYHVVRATYWAWDDLRSELARVSPPTMTTPAPFAGGAAGFVGYDTGQDGTMPVLFMGLYDLVATFDHQSKRAWITSSGLPESDPARRTRRARARLDWALRKPVQTTYPFATTNLQWQADWTRAAYLIKAERVRDYIRAGDICQANLTMRFSAARQGISADTLYTRLRRISPAPFSAYLQCGNALALVSASPERFLQMNATGAIETRPIKGTRPRGMSPEHDAALRADLAASAKDRAENLMITDLLRHDLGQVAEIGTVRVPSLCAVETFHAVHHLVSVVTAQRRAGLGSLNVLQAAFPGGSVTGAPKIRAMQIIQELEAAPRGPYCGAIGWIGWDGAMDFSIAIRTLVATPDHVYAQAGGAIVADSDPKAEYEEAMLKVAPLLQAGADAGL